MSNVNEPQSMIAQRALEKALKLRIADLEGYYRLSSRMEDGSAGADLDVEAEADEVRVVLTDWINVGQFNRSQPIVVVFDRTDGRLQVRMAEESDGDGQLSLVLEVMPSLVLGYAS